MTSLIEYTLDAIDEVIAVLIVTGYLASWFMGNPMPTEPLMIILGYYFGKKVNKK